MLDILVQEFIEKNHKEEAQEHKDRIAQYKKWVEKKKYRIFVM